MKATAINLKGVTVRVKPIEIHKDTINYNMSAFQGKDDKYLADVLKKLPGVVMADDGTISYKGNPINKFNIEGQDLLGNKYNQATMNLPADAVSKIQVMENDQPIRVLKDKSASEKATLNIKLKSGYKMKPFGEAQISAGGFSDALWNNHLTLIEVGRKNQFLSTLKMNNTGENLGKNTLDHIDINDYMNYEPTPNEMISSSLPFFLPLNSSRYLQNRSVSAGLNFLHRIGQYGNLRTNITYFGDRQTPSDSTAYYFGGENPVTLYETNRRKNRNQSIDALLHYELNAPKVYLTDDLSSSLSYISNRDRTYTNSQFLSENVSRHPAYIKNKMQMTVNAGLKTFDISSLTRYFRRSELLDVADTPVVYSMHENVCLESMMTRNSVSSHLLLGKNTMDVIYMMEYHHDNIRTDSCADGGSSRLGNTLKIDYVQQYSRGNIRIILPVSLFDARIPWRQSGKNEDKLLFSPEIHWRHDFTPLWRLTVSAFYSKDEKNDLLYPCRYSESYRSRTLLPDDYGFTRNTSLSFSLNYTNLMSFFTWNLMASASWQKNDNYNEYRYEKDFTYVTPIWKDNRSKLIYASMRAEKTFPNVGVSMKGSVDFNRSQLPIAQNGVEQDITSNILSTSLNMISDGLSWLTLSDNFTFNIFWQDNYDGIKSYALKSFYNSLKMRLYPCRAASVQLSVEHNVMETEKGKYDNISFIDASVRYGVSKRMELNLSADNLLNKKKYVNASFSGLNYKCFSMPIRGREFLLSATIKI